MTDLLGTHGAGTVETGAELRLRAVSGHDEEYLIEAGRSLQAARVTGLLARCLTDAHGRPVDADRVRGLTVGRREQLLLALRRATFGDRIACVLTCPACEQPMDADLSVSELLRDAAGENDSHEVTFEAGGEAWVAGFRLPNGGDQEAVAVMARSDPEAAGRAILDRCLQGVTRPGDAGDQPLPDGLVDAIEAAMEDADPQAETALAVTCPECGEGFVTYFDAGDYLFRELGAYARGLFDDVHQLAVNYHWSEDEILSLTRGRRQTYLRLLAESAGEEAP